MQKHLVAIVGRPNVGKSTLFNRIIGKRKALVQDIPGITRDRHYAETDWDGMVFRLLDTGGLEFESKDRLQKKMSEQVLSGIEEAAVVIFVMDGKTGVTALDREWVEKVRKIKKPKLFVVNKVDSAAKETYITDFYELGMDNLIPVSAETGRGVNDLLDKVNEILGKIKNLPSEVQEERGDEFKIAIIGRPNVGKSTLLNRLVGQERAIVDETAGTTRDPVDSLITYENETFRLVDTAGIRKKGKIDQAIEKFSIVKSLKSIEDCHLAILLLDGSVGVTDQDAHVAGEAFKRNKALIFLVNKWDLQEQTEEVREEFKRAIEFKLTFVKFCPVLFLSAKTGSGIKKLFPTVLRVKDQYNRRVQTSDLNKEFERIIGSHPLPMHAGRNIKVFYAAQTGTAPPTFVIFSNEPKHIHFSYQRYLINSIKEAFGFKEVPIKVIYRKRD